MASPRIPPAGVVRVVERVRNVLDRVHQRSVPPTCRGAGEDLRRLDRPGHRRGGRAKVADALADGPLTIDELAVRVGADADALAGLRVSSSFLG